MTFPDHFTYEITDAQLNFVSASSLTSLLMWQGERRCGKTTGLIVDAFVSLTSRLRPTQTYGKGYLFHPSDMPIRPIDFEVIARPFIKINPQSNNYMFSLDGSKFNGDLTVAPATLDAIEKRRRVIPDFIWIDNIEEMQNSTLQAIIEFAYRSRCPVKATRQLTLLDTLPFQTIKTRSA